MPPMAVFLNPALVLALAPLDGPYGYYQVLR
jgi:hypothetical protein